MTRDEITASLQSFFRDHREDIVLVYLFGSVARGDDRATSDVDVAVLYEVQPPETLSGLDTTFELQEQIRRQLGRTVDVVALNTAPADLAHRVLRDGVLLLDRDPSRRIAFEVAVRREYFDLEPLRRRYRAAAGGSR